MLATAMPLPLARRLTPLFDIPGLCVILQTALILTMIAAGLAAGMPGFGRKRPALVEGYSREYRYGRRARDDTARRRQFPPLVITFIIRQR